MRFITMNPIPWYKSNTLRALLIAGLAQLATMVGITDAVTSEDITGAVDKLLDVVSLVATAWAAWARARQPTPPVSQAALMKTLDREGGFVRPLMLALLIALALPVTLALNGCAALGLPVPQTFSERLASGYSSVTSVRTSARILLDGKVISSSDAENVQRQADVAREALDIARSLPELDAENKLQSALDILTAARAYLCAKQSNDPNCQE